MAKSPGGCRSPSTGERWVVSYDEPGIRELVSQLKTIGPAKIVGSYWRPGGGPGSCDAAHSRSTPVRYNWERSVSVNLGLPFIRTSVDHGTASSTSPVRVSPTTRACWLRRTASAPPSASTRHRGSQTGWSRSWTTRRRSKTLRNSPVWRESRTTCCARGRASLPHSSLPARKLGTLDRRHAGGRGFNRDSGTLRTVWGGRARVRAALCVGSQPLQPGHQGPTSGCWPLVSPKLDACASCSSTQLHAQDIDPGALSEPGRHSSAIHPDFQDSCSLRSE